MPPGALQEDITTAADGAMGTLDTLEVVGVTFAGLCAGVTG